MKDETMTDSDAPEWPDPGDRTHAVEQAKRLRNQVNEGGLRFEAYLPPSLALWLLDLIEQGKFRRIHRRDQRSREVGLPERRARPPVADRLAGAVRSRHDRGHGVRNAGGRLQPLYRR